MPPTKATGMSYIRAVIGATHRGRLEGRMNCRLAQLPPHEKHSNGCAKNHERCETPAFGTAERGPAAHLFGSGIRYNRRNFTCHGNR